MDLLWSSPKPLSSAIVRQRLAGPHAYTTVMTVLKRLFLKKLTKRRKIGNTFYYSASTDRHTFASACLDDLFPRVLSSYGPIAVSSFKKISARFNSS